jgi:uncharacterized protein YecE (DUF72 family)
MQDALFPDAPAPEPQPAGRTRKNLSGDKVPALPTSDETLALARSLPAALRLGTSSWTYPGWNGLVWNGDFSEATLSKHGLPAYAKHPLLRTVCLDRSFYRPLSALQYANLAAQVPDDFRFVVKAPSSVTDALVRGEDGKGQQTNPVFLNPELATQEFVLPALDGLGHKLGVLVFQLSPLPVVMLARLDEVFDALHRLLRALPPLRAAAPDAVVAVEVRDPEFLVPAFAELLRDTGATFCLGVHPKMPPIDQQLPVLRALWPGPLVCRWNFNRAHGAYGYEAAEKRYAPFDRIVDADPDTRDALVQVIAGTLRGGQPAYVTVSNKTEGSSPLSIVELARVLVRPKG